MPIEASPGNTQESKLEPPQPNPYNVQAVKQYVFNETGNIMFSSTELGGDTITDSVRDIFSEVAVFFSAMTKAISTSINPDTKKPYSIYDYTAIQSVIDGSGLFVHVTQEDITHNTTSFGANFSKELIEGLLGLATGVGALSFAQGMIASMGSRGLEIGGSSESSDSKVANIIFICEYILGMPTVSAMVVYCDATLNKQTFSTGPCFSETSTSTSLKLHKDTYMFVTPTFIKKYSGDLDSVTNDLEFVEFVDYLQALVQRRPIITSVETLDGTSAPSALDTTTTYAILGAFLDNNGTSPTTVKVAWAGPNNKPGTEVTNAEVQGNMISFSPTAMEIATAIGVYFNPDPKTDNWILAVATPLTYTAKAPPK